MQNSIKNILIVLISLTLGNTALHRDASAKEQLFKPDAFSQYKGDVNNGETLFNAAGCASCHSSGDDLKLLSGGMKMDTYVGKIFVPNITKHSNGIGGWTNSQFLNAVTNGVSPKGRHYFPVFPYTFYAGMKPEDVLDIKAYIESLPESDNKVPKHEVGFPYNMNATMAFWKRSNFKTPRWQPGNNDQKERGRYLVENVGACGSCHTPRTFTLGVKKDEALSGYKGLTGAHAPAINKARLASIQPEQFTKGSLIEGKKLGGQPFADPIMRKISQGTAMLEADDRKAMLAYITGKEIKPEPKPDLVVATCKTDEVQQVAAGGGGNPHAAAADEFIGQYCRNCHGPGESSQGSFPAGDLASIAADAAFITPGDPENSRFMKSILSGRMPIGRRPSDEEIQSVSNWIKELGNEANGTQIAPPSAAERKRDIIGRPDLYKAAIEDVGALSELDRPFMRYFNYAFQFNGKFPCEDDIAFSKRLKLYKIAFNKLLNSVSLGNAIVVPSEVENTKGLLVRIDIRDLSWEAKDWDTLVEAYPYGIDPDSSVALKTLSSEMDTQLPMMRSDWFMSGASSPKLYHALLKLPENIRELEKAMDIDVDQNIKDFRVVRAAFERGSSGVSAHNRMIERHKAPQGGYYWKSYDMAGSFGRQSLKENPHGPEEIGELPEGLKSFEHDGGEMIFSLPNGLQGYYLSDNKGNRLDDAPEKIVSYQKRPKDKAPTIINGRACFDCHADGILTKRDQIRKHIISGNSFSLSQQQLLLQMYVEQKELDDLYDADRDLFLDALEKLGGVEKTGNGRKSIPAPGNKEIITWYADLYDDNLNMDEVAAEFYMDEKTFRETAPRIADATAQRIVTSWLLQLDGGSKIPRFEIEQQIPYLLEAVLDVKPLIKKQGDKEEKKEAKTEAKAEKKEPAKDKVTKAKIPQYKQAEYVDGDKLKLSVDVKSTDVSVKDKMTFKITANKLCELKIIYVDSKQVIDVFPQQLIGPKDLQPNEARAIPTEGSGEIIFDEPGHDESMILFCSEPSYKGEPFTKETALKMAKASKKHATRGIVIKLAKKVEESKGEAATHMVSFNVK